MREKKSEDCVPKQKVSDFGSFFNNHAYFVLQGGTATSSAAKGEFFSFGISAMCCILRFYRACRIPKQDRKQSPLHPEFEVTSFRSFVLCCCNRRSPHPLSLLALGSRMSSSAAILWLFGSHRDRGRNTISNCLCMPASREETKHSVSKCFASCRLEKQFESLFWSLPYGYATFGLGPNFRCCSDAMLRKISLGFHRKDNFL